PKSTTQALGSNKAIKRKEKAREKLFYCSSSPSIYPASKSKDPQRNDTRAYKKHTRNEESTLNPLLKKHKASDTRIATLAIRVLTNDPTVKIEEPMIARNEGCGSKGASN
ncbi:hypothetical protein Tco_1261446, partial [Tanacetum coccineum]